MKKKIIKANSLLDKFFKWVVISSANPEKASLTIKGILIQHIGLAVLIFTTLHVDIDKNQIAEHIGRFSSIVGTVLALIGMVRKLYFEGKAWVNEK